MQREPFENIPEKFKYHYVFLLKKEPEGEIPQGKWGRWSQPPIPKTESMRFVDYLSQCMREDEWRIKVSGKTLMHLWTVDNDWEVFVKLSGEFRHHYTGIMARHKR